MLSLLQVLVLCQPVSLVILPGCKRSTSTKVGTTVLPSKIALLVQRRHPQLHRQLRLPRQRQLLQRRHVPNAISHWLRHRFTVPTRAIIVATGWAWASRIRARGTITQITRVALPARPRRRHKPAKKQTTQQGKVFRVALPQPLPDRHVVTFSVSSLGMATAGVGGHQPIVKQMPG